MNIVSKVNPKKYVEGTMSVPTQGKAAILNRAAFPSIFLKRLNHA